MAKREKSEEQTITGTSRVIKGGVVVIPGPTVIKTADNAAKASEPKKDAPNVPPFVQVSSAHLIAELNTSRPDRILYRLEALGRVNRDVRWLLDEFNKSKNNKSDK